MNTDKERAGELLANFKQKLLEITDIAEVEKLEKTTPLDSLAHNECIKHLRKLQEEKAKTMADECVAPEDIKLLIENINTLDFVNQINFDSIKTIFEEKLKDRQILKAKEIADYCKTAEEAKKIFEQVGYGSLTSEIFSTRWMELYLQENP